MKHIPTNSFMRQNCKLVRIALIGCIWLLAVTGSFAQVPAAPTSVTATTASSTQINLTWVDASTNETGFQIERSTTSGTGFTLIFTTAANAVSYSDAGVVANTMYYYRIRSTNGSGSSAYSTQTGSSTITPSAPSGLTATVGTTTSINLAWVDGSADETGFQIWMSTTAGSGYSLIATNPANQVTRSVTGLSVNVRYYFQVRAINGALTSAYTNEATAITSTPALPTSVTAIATSPTQITLSWVDNATIETGYGVERSTTSGTGFVLVTTAAINATGFVDTGLTTGTTYYYRIRALNGGLPSAYTTQISTAIVVPAAPTTLAATAASATQVNLTWVDASTNETGFVVERSTTSGSGFTIVTTTAANATSYSDVSAVANTTYYYRIRSTNGVGSSANTAEVMVATSVPSTPTNFVASLTNSSGQITLTWTDASNNETGFEIERSSSSPSSGFSLVFTNAANTASRLNTGLTVNTWYYYRIRSINAVGASSYSPVASVYIGIPAGPTGVIHTIISPTQVDFTWTDPNNFETGYVVQRSTTSTTAGFVVAGSLPPNSVSFSDVGLTTGTVYYYRIQAVNGVVATNSSVLTVSLTVPAVPTLFRGWPSTTTEISMSWTDNATNESGYEIERSTTSGSGYTLINTTAANATTFTNTGLTNGSTYYYRIRSKNPVGLSAYSSEIVVPITAPIAPTSPVATPASITQINLTWTDNSNNESAFRVERGTTATGPFTFLFNTSPNVVFFASAGLNPGVRYFYRILSTNGVGSSSFTSVFSAATYLVAPTNVFATAFSTSQINLTWTDASSNETGYQIERSLTAGSGYVLVATTAAQATSYSDTGLLPGVTYYYQIRAINAVSNSLYTTASAPTPFVVDWTNMKDVTVNGDNSISKNTATTELDAGASSLNKILPNTDGWIDFTYQGTGIYTVGLGVTDVKDMYQFNFSVNNAVSIQENGVQVQSLANGVAGTKYRISKVGTSLNYLVNSVVVRTSAVPADMPLVTNVNIGSGSVPAISCTFDKQIRLSPSIILPNGANTGGAISVNVQGTYPPTTIGWTSGENVSVIANKSRGSYAITVSDQKGRSLTRNYQLGYLVKWADLQNVELDANNRLVRKNQTGDWDGSATSTNLLAASTDGWVEFATQDLKSNSIIGLSTFNNLPHFNSIAYGFYLYDNQVKIYESGVSVATVGYIQEGDVYKISREGTDIKYSINNQVIRTIATIATQPLIVDAAIVSGYVPQLTCSFYRTQQSFYAIKDGSWTDPTVWSNTPGGAASTYYPSELDNVTVQGYLVTVKSGVSCGNLDIIVAAANNDKASVLVNGISASLKIFGNTTIKGQFNTKTVNALMVSNNGKIDVLPSIN